MHGDGARGGKKQGRSKKQAHVYPSLSRLKLKLKPSWRGGGIRMVIKRVPMRSFSITITYYVLLLASSFTEFTPNKRWISHFLYLFDSLYVVNCQSKQERKQTYDALSLQVFILSSIHLALVSTLVYWNFVFYTRK